MNYGIIRDRCIRQAKIDIRNSIPHSQMILAAFRMLEELKRVHNTVLKRLEDWYGLYFPELVHSCGSHESFLKSLESANKPDDSMGMKWDCNDFDSFKECVKTAKSLQSAIILQENYVDSLMLAHCPNVRAVAGSNIGANLVTIAGSLEKIARMPSSTIQLLGAEKSLFRHIKTGARPPRHGILLHHPIVARQKQALRGKAARALADKISVAARIDFFKGSFIGDTLRKGLEEKYQ